jgi:F420-non-reducing hydrogenase small subunit
MALTERPEGHLELPTLDDEVKALDQVVPVDYYVPGCAPPVKLLKDALTAILTSSLPPKGAVLAPDMALCAGCPRGATKPDRPLIDKFRRPHAHSIDPELCLLAQGFLCLGPATRAGCDWACINANMPCSGCLGPVSRTHDFGAAAMSALASLVNSNDEGGIESALDAVPDPVGTFYRYGLPASMLFAKVGTTSRP